MNTRRILHYVIGAALEVVLILAMWLLLWWLPDRIYYLDLVVLSVMLWSWVLTTRLPLVDPDDPAQRAIGALGPHWYTVIYYTIAAAVVMGVGLALELADVNTFRFQIVIQVILMVLLGAGLLMCDTTQAKVAETYYRESEKKRGLTDMREALGALTAAAAAGNVPPTLRDDINALADEARFISPCTEPRAVDIERQVINLSADTSAALADLEANREDIYNNVTTIRNLINLRRRQQS